MSSLSYETQFFWYALSEIPPVSVMHEEYLFHTFASGGFSFLIAHLPDKVHPGNYSNTSQTNLYVIVRFKQKWR